MEASQASEAGSIPVARSTPRPAARRAVLLCPLRAYNGDWRRHQHPREPRAHTNGCGTVQRGIARHKGPTRGRHSAQGLRGVPPPLPAWRAPRRLQNMGAVPVGLKYLAQHGPNTGTSTKKLAQHKASGRISVQNSPSKNRETSYSIQNSPSSLEMPLFRLFCACRANFVSLLTTASRAGRTFSRRLIETAEHGAFSLTLGVTTSQD